MLISRGVSGNDVRMVLITDFSMESVVGNRCGINEYYFYLVDDNFSITRQSSKIFKIQLSNTSKKFPI